MRSYSRSGLLRYKIAPKCSLSGPFCHSGVGRDPEVAGPVRSYNLVFTYPCQPETPPKRTSRGRPGRPQAWTIHSSQRRTTSLGPPWRRSAGARESPGGGPGDNRPGLNSPVTQQSQDRGASPGGVTIQQPETLDEYQQIFRAYTGLASTGDAGKDQALWQAESQRGRGWLRPGRTRCWPWPPSSARSQPTGWT